MQGKTPHNGRYLFYEGCGFLLAPAKCRRNYMVPEKLNLPVLLDTSRSVDGAPLSVDARLSERRADGSVAGSYDARTMDALLHYHAMDAAPAAGRLVVGGEAVEG
jgi:hypothetical protein